MTFEEAKKIFLNRGYIEVPGGTYYDADKWRESITVISKWLEQEPCEDTAIRKIDEFEVKGKTAEVWIVKGKLQIRCLGVIHNIPLSSITLKQQLCEDCVSRRAVLDTLDKMDKALDDDRSVESYKTLLTECYKDLPPVIPKEMSYEQKNSY